MYEICDGNQIKKKILLKLLENLIKNLHQSGIFISTCNFMKVKRCKFNSEYLKEIGLKFKQGVLLKFDKATNRRKAQLLIVACKIYLLIYRDECITKRNLYYQFKDCFLTIESCYNCIEDICCFFGVSRTDLNIISTSKGLIAGSIIFEFENKIINCNEFKEGYSIPSNLNKLKSIKTNSQFVLLIEKDAIFQQLLNQNFLKRQNIIMITGKGFPDTNTRELIQMLSKSNNLPILGLFDADPFGIEILNCYKFGSLSLSHHCSRLAAPNIIWIGLYPSEIHDMSLICKNLNQHDWKKIYSFMKRDYILKIEKLNNEIKWIKSYNKKTGLESLNYNSLKDSKALINYIIKKIHQFTNNFNDEFEEVSQNHWKFSLNFRV